MTEKKIPTWKRNLIRITSVEEAEQIKPLDYSNNSIFKLRMDLPTYHLGTLCINRYSDYNETYKILKYLFENKILPPLKIFKWGDVIADRKEKRLASFNGLNYHSMVYNRFLPHGWTSKPDPKYIGGMNFQSIDGDDKTIHDYCMEKDDPYYNDQGWLTSLNSSYYHSAKAHWLVHSIQREGLWAPVQGLTSGTKERYSIFAHPGSIRSAIVEEMQDPDLVWHVWDCVGVIPTEPKTVDEFLQFWKEVLNKKNVKQDEMSFIIQAGAIEVQTDLASLEFRNEIYDFNKKVSKLAKKKPLNIYIGYDSTHNDIEKISKYSIEESIKRNFSGGNDGKYTQFVPEIKMLDISKIPEYTRPYANQNTEFTYSRFLIPYLENYEGFSIFVDDDFIFNKTILSLLYYLHPDDAVACIQYPQYKHDNTKFVGAVNIDYPRKLWSSMMVFNNGHEDCKKLTPETINTWTGKQLHQFEWTEKISKIPEKYIFTEGYDDPETKWDVSGYHYTRGGPWIDDMDCSKISRLEVYEKFKTLYESER